MATFLRRCTHSTHTNQLGWICPTHANHYGHTSVVPILMRVKMDGLNPHFHLTLLKPSIDGPIGLYQH